MLFGGIIGACVMVEDNDVLHYNRSFIDKPPNNRERDTKAAITRTENINDDTVVFEVDLRLWMKHE